MSTQPGRDQEPIGVDGAGGRSAQVSDVGYSTVVDGDIGGSGLGAGAVDQRATPNDQFMHVLIVPRRGAACRQVR